MKVISKRDCQDLARADLRDADSFFENGVESDGERTSVLNQKFAALYHTLAGVLYQQKRSMEARISSADLVHRKGFGSALC